MERREMDEHFPALRFYLPSASGRQGKSRGALML